jgi:hypothetical protein
MKLRLALIKQIIQVIQVEHRFDLMARNKKKIKVIQVQLCFYILPRNNKKKKKKKKKTRTKSTLLQTKLMYTHYDSDTGKL